MILRGLHVESFAGLNPGARIDAFSEHITVIHGPNQAGKSTLFRALTYGLYQRHTVTGAEAERHLLPAGTQVSPRVAITFDVGGVTYRITKHFLRKASARLERQQGESFVVLAEGQAADEQLRDRLNSGFAGRGLTKAEQWGMGEILMVDQGKLRFGETLGERVQQDLRGILGQVGTPEATHGLMRRVKARYDQVFTPLGDLKKGASAPPAVRLKDELAALDAELASLTRDLNLAQEIEERLSVRAQSTTDAERIQKQLEDDRKGALTSQLAFAARAAEMRHQEGIAQTSRRDAQAFAEQCASLRTARAELEELSRRWQSHLARRAQLESEQGLADQAVQVAEQALERVEAERIQVERRAQESADARRASEIATHLQEGEQRLGRHTELGKEIERLRGRLAERVRPTRAQLQRLRARFDAVRECEQKMAALSLRLRITREGPQLIEVQGEVLALEPGVMRDLAGPEPMVLRVPGVVTFEVRGPAGSDPSRAAAELRERQRELEAERAPFGPADFAALEGLEAERQELERALQVAIGKRDGQVESDAKLAALREGLARLQSEWSVLQQRHADWKSEVPSAGHRAVLEQTHRDQQRQFDTQLAERRAGILAARQQQGATRERAKLADQERADEETKRARAAARVDELSRSGLTDEARTARLAHLELEASTQERKVREEREALDALGDPEAQVRSSDAALLQHRRQREAERESQIRDETDLQRYRDRGLWLRGAQLEEQRERGQRDLQRAQLDTDAIRKLYTALRDEQRQALDAITAPLTHKVTKLMRAALGRSVRPHFGDRLLPDRLVLDDDRDLDLEQLSAGTRDQVALMTRLALGEFYCRNAGRHAFVLDDPLVNTDRERRTHILDILDRSTKDLQVVIFTCHPEHYFGLPESTTRWIAVQDIVLKAATD